MGELDSLFVNIVKKISYVVEYILFEIVLYILGTQSIVEDLIFKSKNKCEVVVKSGEIAVVTGGARGIGAALVKKLLQCHMTVIIGCRNVDAGIKTIQQIRNEGINTGETHVYKLDLESLKSVKEFADKVSRNFPFLNLVVNNAGIMFPPYHETIDGFESQFAVNYLAPFYLTHLLMPLLNKQESARVVNVTSISYIAAKQIHFDNINMKQNYIPSASYAQSKLCMLLFTLELDRQLREENSNVYILAVHPGIVNTELFNGTVLKIIFPWVLKYICKNMDDGATTVLAPCISNTFDKKGGMYLSNCSIVPPTKLARDTNLQRELFNYSLNVLNINTFGQNL